jgi:hypothetical protein
MSLDRVCPHASSVATCFFFLWSLRSVPGYLSNFSWRCFAACQVTSFPHMCELSESGEHSEPCPVLTDTTPRAGASVLHFAMPNYGGPFAHLKQLLGPSFLTPHLPVGPIPYSWCLSGSYMPGSSHLFTWSLVLCKDETEIHCVWGGSVRVLKPN